MTNTATATAAAIADEQAPLEAAEMFGYDSEWLDKAPEGAVASFPGVGNPHARSELKPGETVLDLGSGPGWIASLPRGKSDRQVG